MDDTIRKLIVAYDSKLVGTWLEVEIMNLMRLARQGAYEDAAIVARSQGTWVEADSYRAQCDMRERIANAVRQRAKDVDK